MDSNLGLKYYEILEFFDQDYFKPFSYKNYYSLDILLLKI